MLILITVITILSLLLNIATVVVLYHITTSPYPLVSTTNNIISSGVNSTPTPEDNSTNSIDGTVVNNLFKTLMSSNNENSKLLVSVVNQAETKLNNISVKSKEILLGMALDRTQTVLLDFSNRFNTKLTDIYYNLDTANRIDIDLVLSEIERLKAKDNLSPAEGNKLLELREQKKKYETMNNKIAENVSVLMDLNRQLDNILEQLFSTARDDSGMELSMKIKDLTEIITRIQNI